MQYHIKHTVIAARQLKSGDVVPAEGIGTEDRIARLLELGAIEAVEGASAATGPESDPDLPEIDDALRAVMIEAVGKLPKDGFILSGKPSVEALQAALPDHADRITAAARDAIWEEMKAAADAAF